MQYFRIHTAAALAALALAACGGDKAVDKREADIEAYAKAHGVDAEVTVDALGEVSSVTVKQGSGTVGNDLGLPAGFPEDVKLPASWTIQSSSPVPPGGFMLTGMAQDTAEGITAAVREALTAEGWTETAFETPSPAMTQMGFEKGTRMTNINVMDTGGETLSVQILTMEKP